jgi:HlyD family secretion protein
LKSKTLWISLIVILVLGAGAYFFRSQLPGFASQQAAAQGNTTEQTESTITIRPATDISQVSAAGNIALASQQSAVLQVEGLIKEVAVDVGDTVAQGDLLVALDTAALERAVRRAELALETSQSQLDELLEPASSADLAAAQANLAAAQEKLAELEAGPAAAELTAAQTGVTAAQASYDELLAGQSEAELTQLSADLHKSFITLQQAQGDYDRIAYRDDIGSSSQAIALQEATIDYDTAKAAYEVATSPASASEVQEALSNIWNAQQQLAALYPTKAEVVAAQAEVAGVEASLAELQSGPSEAGRHEAELAIKQAEIDLEEAQAELAAAELRSPIEGTILSLDVEVGQQATKGLTALTMADLTALELTVNVAEVDISKLREGQPASVTIDAVPDQVFTGEVVWIAPSSESDSGVVNYPVTVRLNDVDLAAGIRPGMTAVATIADERMEAGWLVPSSSLVEFEGETSISVIRNGQRVRVTVTPAQTQGEWTVVQSSDLQAGDKVVGEVASFLDEDSGFGGGRGPFGPPPR